MNVSLLGPLSKPWAFLCATSHPVGQACHLRETRGGVGEPCAQVTQLIFEPRFADGTALTVPFRHDTANMNLDGPACLRRSLPP